MDHVSSPPAGELKRTNSLPDIPKGRPISRSTFKKSSFRKKSNMACDSVPPVNLLSPVTSLPIFHPTHRRAKSRDYIDGNGLISERDSRETSPFELREAGLIFSYDSTSTRSNTISTGSGRSRSGSQSSHCTLPNSIENSSESRGHRGSSANPELELDDIDGDTPLPPVGQDSLESECIDLEHLRSNAPLSVSDILDIKPFRVDVSGSSILHIIAKEGYHELLSLVLKVADYLKRSIDFSLLNHRDGHTARLPIEEAILAKSTECVRLLIHFMVLNGMIGELLVDPLILKNAVFTSDIEIVKILVEFGFIAGIGPAISLAMLCEYDAILRMLLYFQTQVVNAMEFSRIRRNRLMTLDRGGINWEGIQLEQIDPTWLYDSYEAADSVSRNFELNQIFMTPEGNCEFFSQLGQDCLHYFNERISSPSHTLGQRQLTQITEINVSENLLTDVPQELFQMPSLLVLRLAHNQLRSLPSSNNPNETIYTADIRKLELDWNQLESLPEDLFRGLAHSLTELSAECNLLKDLPPGMWVSPKLKVVKLARNNLSRLHYLSNPCFFVDVDLTKQVVGSFTSENGELRCSVRSDNPAETRDLNNTERYLNRLASYYHTVCTAQCTPGSPVPKYDTYQEVINVHLSRHIFYGHYVDTSEHGSTLRRLQNQPGQLLLPAADEDDEHEAANLSSLENLDMSFNRFQEIPWDLPCIAPQLNKLDLRGNSIKDLDIVHGLPNGIKSLILDNNQIVSLKKMRPVSLPCGHPLRLLALPEENYGSVYCKHCKHDSLEALTNLSLDRNQLWYFPVVDVVSESQDDPELQAAFDIRTVSFLAFYPNLSILSLEYNHFTTVPKHLHHLTHLSSLSLSYNQIHALPPQMGLMNSQNLLLLKLEGVFLKNIPENLLNKPTPKYLLSYLKALLQK